MRKAKIEAKDALARRSRGSMAELEDAGAGGGDTQRLYKRLELGIVPQR
jgi:hypothetical protein